MLSEHFVCEHVKYNAAYKVLAEMAVESSLNSNCTGEWSVTSSPFTLLLFKGNMLQTDCQ